MDPLAKIDLTMKVLIGAATLVGILVGFRRVLLPRWKSIKSDIRAGRDALVGRREQRDSITGTLIAPALPGIGVRMANNETQLERLADAVAILADNALRLTTVEHRVDEHDERLNRLDAAVVERVATRVESTQAWAAVEAVAKSQPPD